MSSSATSKTADLRDTRGDALRRVGAALREAREARGEDLYEVAEYLRIKPSYLFALEEGDLSMTPGRPYALGFLRTYADYLGFDGGEVVRLVKESLDGAPPAPELVVPEPVGDDRRPRGILVAASILLAGLVYGGWHVIGRDRPILERVAAVPGELGRLAGEMLAGPPAAPRAPSPAAPPAPSVAVPQPQANVDPAMAPAATRRAAPAGAAIEALVASEPEEELGRMPPPPARRDSTAALAAERSAESGAGPTPMQLLAALDPTRAGREAGATGEGRVVLVARETAWVQIRSAGRDYVRTRTLEPGERMVMPERDDLALWTGNAGGIEILLDGRSLGPLGETGKVLRDVPLAPAALEARFARR
ncbi:MAG: DUF4115 domain-containing protein [Geminicoccaceae bacterium]|nr:DUF4115 domain-containing protein [Geminicoccaceae bacterium]MCX8101469.1 DUF4115 domain-containing protein [Geminicoccaceae bacterium]MDW8369202.1 DUF4115 domain-containing protein [Geminicoccaceae bacterium]